MTTTTKVILGITAAALTGAAIGMLLAPEKGTDLQRKIKDGAKDWIKELSALLGTGKEIASELNSKLNLKGITSELIDLDENEGTPFQSSHYGSERK